MRFTRVFNPAPASRHATIPPWYRVRAWWRATLVVVMVGVLVAALLAVGQPAADARAVACRRLRLPVALAPGTATNLTVAGALCLPRGARRVDVLVPGATYDHRYWDWPDQRGRYSFVRRTLAAGRATFTYDRYGTGASGRPASVAVTVAAEAYLLHQIIDWLRGRRGFAGVDVVGHSFGSIVAVHEAAVHHDVDRLVLTGYLHATGPAAVRPDTLYPAAMDPRFAGRGYDFGYLTTRPGVRGSLFYAPSADPAVITSDEASKDVVSGTFFAGGIAETSAPPGAGYSDRVAAPVLLVNGEDDQLYCGRPLDCSDAVAVRANEVPHFAAAASLTSVVIAGTGHDLVLHPSVGATFAAVDRWLGRRPPRPGGSRQ